MYKGVMGKILFVNLSTGDINVEEPDEQTYRDYLGGYGLGARILFSRQKGGVDPLGPDNTLGFVTGVLTGTPAVLGNRYIVVAKSPLTGGWGDANSGGDFGPYLKFAGYDAVFFTGTSAKPVYLHINEGQAELKDASALWGKDVEQTDDILKDELGKDVRIACIGPAGEKLARLACIMNDKGRAAGRCGLGAVMGSKNLKAIAVYGTKAVPLADDVKVKALKKEQQATLLESRFVGMLQKGGGTSGFTAGMTGQGEAPIKNWGGNPTDMPDASTFAADKILELREKKYSCWRCPIGCGGIMKAGTEYNYPAGAHKPEYETEAAFGGLCLNNNLESVIMAGHICNVYGLDTISAGGTIAFAIECYENGIITKEDTGGIELTWGNHKAIVEMTEKMAKREGFGDILADGVKAAAEKIGKGSEKYAMHVGGEEIAMHDPKNSPRFASGYAIDAAPGRHTQGGANEIEGDMQKAKNTYCQAYNATGVCMWAAGMMGENTVAEMLSAVTGVEYSVEKLLEAGERISNIRQAFNVREGINPMERNFPGRVFGQPPLAEGPTAGKSVDVKPRAVEYFKAMDWDVDTGKPSKEKLIEMGMEDVASELWG